MVRRVLEGEAEATRPLLQLPLEPPISQQQVPPTAYDRRPPPALTDQLWVMDGDAVVSLGLSGREALPGA